MIYTHVSTASLQKLKTSSTVCNKVTILAMDFCTGNNKSGIWGKKVLLSLRFGTLWTVQ